MLFDDVVGQGHVVKTLKNAIELKRISHAFLFSGPRGTGKTSMAKIFARAINCISGPQVVPCGTCVSCIALNENSSLDVIEIDAASNRGIDEMRDLREKVKFAPSQGRYKVYIIDEAHMLTTEASNALLKTLEEPPEHVVFILATTESNRILPTIHSRCQRFDFRRLSVNELSGHISKISQAEGINIEPLAVSLIARKADGGVRDALSLLEQAVSWTGNDITQDKVSELMGITDFQMLANFVKATASKSTGELFEIFSAVLSQGKDPKQFLADLIQRFMNVLMTKESSSDLLDVSQDEKAYISEEAKLYTKNDLIRILERLALCEQEIKKASNVKISVELAIASICKVAPDLSDVIMRLEALESSKANMGYTTADRHVSDSNRDDSGQKSSVAIKHEKAIDTSDIFDIDSTAWQRTLLFVKSKKPALHAFMNPIIAVRAEGNCLKLGFKLGWPLHIKMVSESENMSVIAEAIKSTTGKSYSLECYVFDENGNESNTKAADYDKKAFKEENEKLDDINIVSLETNDLIVKEKELEEPFTKDVLPDTEMSKEITSIESKLSFFDELPLDKDADVLEVTKSVYEEVSEDVDDDGTEPIQENEPNQGATGEPKSLRFARELFDPIQISLLEKEDE